jgi:hypothetical protein
MDYSDPFNMQSKADTDGFKDKENVELILIEKTFCRKYMKELEERNAKEREKADALGVDFTPIPPTHKEGGLAYTFAVRTRSHDEDKKPFENVFKPEHKKYIEPNYVCFGKIEVPTPVQLLDGAIGKTKGIDITKRDKFGNPDVLEFLPSTFPKKDWKANKSANQYMDLQHVRNMVLQSL